MPVNGLFKSERLLYRAIENSDEDIAFLGKMLHDLLIQIMSTTRIQRPMTKKSVTDMVKFFQDAVLGVMICLPPDESLPKEETTTTSAPGHQSTSQPQQDAVQPIPIGHVALFNDNGVEYYHHRNATVGISLAEEFRGKGYGGEAMNWALDWAFEMAGLHRVSLNAFSYNENAVKLYRKLGFIEEGREREAIFHRRSWYDVICFPMLEHEWEKLRNGALAEKTRGVGPGTDTPSQQ
ncbi:hypothetical protein FE257_001203 [Aspergillus nanangensis]|uniref:N-acetyltransferase domain-containing protein n=1 Tax=Aspergillus nanangensis TaxID=2582783 RepID=A0AAD4GPX6_ASPNN|nr:hypothetical protein FE257_001203 [Aspergillus nanangensis]